MRNNARHERLTITPGSKLQGTVSVPGDKSISHRAVMLGSIARGESEVRNWLAAGDTEATMGAMQALGAQVVRRDANTLSIGGSELQEADGPLNLMNAGTGIRLLAGIMAGQPFPSVLDGSEQLRRRPMRRVIDPLRQMGADIHAVNGGCPLQVSPAPLQGITYDMPVASGQVKSAILLAGLFADGPTTVIESGPARDHTERMLRAMGVEVDIHNGDSRRVTVQPSQALAPLDLTIPGDFSSAAFLLVAGLLLADSDLTVTGVNLNPTRTGLLDVLQAMNADIETGNQRH